MFEPAPTRSEVSTARGSGVICWLTVTGCALFAVDDVSMLRSLGGGLLASPGWIPIIIAGWLASRDPRFKGLHLTKILIGIFSYGIVITLLTLPALAGDLLGENPVWKSLKFMVSVGVWLMVLVSGAILSRVVPKAVKVGAASAIGLMAAGAVLYHLGNPLLDQNAVVHSYENIQQRVRSTRFEASSLGAGLIACFGLVVIHTVRRLAVLGFSAGLLMIGLLTESRGTMLTVTLTLLVVPLVMLVRSRQAELTSSIERFYAWATAVGAIVLSFRMDYFLSGPIWSVLGLKTEGTSDASRSMWADTALSALAHYPFGMGYAAYLAWLPKLIEESARSALDQFPIRELSEMINLSLAASDATLSPKNLVGIAAVHLGIVGIVLVSFLYSTIIRSSFRVVGPGGDIRLMVSVTLIFVSSTYYASIFSMDQAFLFGALAWGVGRLGKVSDSGEAERLAPSLRKLSR